MKNVPIMEILKERAKIGELERKRIEEREKGGLKHLKSFLGRCTEITNTCTEVLGCFIVA